MFLAERGHFRYFTTINCKFTNKKNINGTERPMRKKLHELPLQCESTWTQMLQHNTLLQISWVCLNMDAYVHLH